MAGLWIWEHGRAELSYCRQRRRAKNRRRAGGQLSPPRSRLDLISSLSLHFTLSLPRLFPSLHISISPSLSHVSISPLSLVFLSPPSFSISPSSPPLSIPSLSLPPYLSLFISFSISPSFLLHPFLSFSNPPSLSVYPSPPVSPFLFLSLSPYHFLHPPLFPSLNLSLSKSLPSLSHHLLFIICNSLLSHSPPPSCFSSASPSYIIYRKLLT